MSPKPQDFTAWPRVSCLRALSLVSTQTCSPVQTEVVPAPSVTLPPAFCWSWWGLQVVP